MTYSGLTVISYGGYLNGESFQQDGILTFNGYQYTCFWNTGRRVILARRALPDGEWSKIEISSYTNSTNDAHNTISLGICPKDGTLHVAFDHHGSDLHYIKSVQNLVTDPSGVPWETSSFNAVTSSLDGFKTVTQVTYPKFISTPQGDLLFEYRYGTSGSGDQCLYEYSGTSHSWSSIGKYIDGISASINAYPHGIVYQQNTGRLHMTWCWRETPDASTNHDLCYIYSDDNGRTWKNDAGSTVAITGTSFITAQSPGIVVWRINQNRGLINQEHMTVDHAGNVHVLLSHMPDELADDSNFTNARTKSYFFHYVKDTNGNWKRNSINIPVILNFRGKIAAASNNDLYAILPDLRIASASYANSWADWSMINSEDSGRFFSDPLIDTARLEYEDVLTIYYPEKNSSNIFTLDYELLASKPSY
ncbi:MAG: BNR repeat-containing protein [Desulfobacteraceae bacterium]